MNARPGAVSAAAILLAATLCWPLEPPASPETSGGSRIVSPAVVATWLTRKAPDALPRLELLVLWRGAPGWFTRADSSAEVESIVRRSPDVFSLLRCETKLPDPKMQPMIDAVCARMKGQ